MSLACKCVGKVALEALRNDWEVFATAEDNFLVDYFPSDSTLTHMAFVEYEKFLSTLTLVVFTVRLVIAILRILETVKSSGQAF